MRLSITILLLLSYMSLVFAQSTKIDEKERARLENQFKALKTFYINDDGLVVYQSQGELSTQDSSKSSREKDSEPQKVSTQAGVSTTEKTLSEEVVVAPVRRIVDRPTYSNYGNSGTTTVSKAPIDPNSIIHTPAIVPASKILESARKEEVVEREKTIGVVENKVVDTKGTLNSDADVKTKLEEENAVAKSKYVSRKSRVQKSPLRYKTMEEAAMAVDDLLEKLKGEQDETSPSSGSMSSRIARGAGKSSLRKQILSEDEINANPYQYGVSQTSNVSQSVSFDLDEEESYMPIYYINGIEVSKSEVDKLRKRDIVSREIRTRNTASGNPAGEIWIEVKESSRP